MAPRLIQPADRHHGFFSSTATKKEAHMRSRKQIAKKQSAAPPVTPIHVELPPVPPPPSPEAAPGAAGQAAANAATLHQLARYAQEVEKYVRSSQLDNLLTKVQSDLQRNPDAPPLRLRRE
jgi:hypothetical protein